MTTIFGDDGDLGLIMDMKLEAMFFFLHVCIWSSLITRRGEIPKYVPTLRTNELDDLQRKDRRIRQSIL